MGFFQPPSLPFQEKPRLVTDEDLGAFREQMGASLLAIRGLQELDLSACSKITDSSITQVGVGHLAGTDMNDKRNLSS